MSALDDWLAADEAPAAVKAAPSSALDSWLATPDTAPPPAPPAQAAPAPAPVAPSVAPVPAERGFLDALGRNIGLGTRNAIQGIGSLPGMVADAASAPGRMIQRGLGMREGTAPTEMLSQGLTAAGLPEAETPGERLRGAAVEGMASALPTMGAGLAMQGGRAIGSFGQKLAHMLTAERGTQFAAGAGSGLAPEAARQNGVGELGQLGAGLAGGVGAGGAATTAKMAGRLLGAAAMPFAQGGREAIVRNTLLQQSADPATLRARLLAQQLDPTLRLPGSPATTAQASQDPGLAMMESGLRSDMAAAPGGISPAARFRNIDTQRNAVRSQALPAPMPEASATRGAELRDRLVPAQGERAGQTSAAYEAVDPDGSSRIPIGGVRETMADLSGKYYGHMSGGMPKELGQLADDLRTAEVVPYSTVQNLHARVVRLQNDLGTDPRAQSLLIGVKKSLDDAAERAALPQEPRSMRATEGDFLAQDAAEGAAQRPDVGAALDEAQAPRHGGYTTERTDGRALNADGTRESLQAFMVRNGGVRDDGGDVLNLLGGTTRSRPGLISSRGMSLDEMRALAQQEGYIGQVGQDVQGQHGTGIDDLLNALHEELNAPRSTSRRSSPLSQEVDRELSQRGMSLNDAPDDVLRGVRDPSEPVPAGQLAPDGFEPVPDGFTPEQAGRWRAAQELRRQQGRDFQRDETGTNAVETILQRGSGGGHNVPDQNVMSHALSSPNAARQVMRAGGDDAVKAMRQAFMDRAHQATTSGIEAADQRPMLREPGWRKFWTANKDTAAVIFPPEHLANLERLANDFGETASASLMSRAAGSDTARNLSVGNVISMVTGGVIDPKNPLAQSLLRPFGYVAGMGEAGIRRLLTDAMADPALAARLVAKAPPEAAALAQAYSSSSGWQRAGMVAGAGGLRTGLQAVENTKPDAEAARRNAMARRLRQ